MRVHHALRGDKRRLQELADRNAALALEHERLRVERSRERKWGALAGLQELLHMDRLPLRIEGYDISNLGGDHIVASMVVFEGAAPLKRDYRRFVIRSLQGQDDVGAIGEVVSRRFERHADASRPEGPADAGHPECHAGAGSPAGAAPQSDVFDPSFAALPDLVLIDGGRGQLSAACAAVRDAGLASSVRVVSLAKREEEVFLPERPTPLMLDRDDPALLLLERVRDEAHRFAVGFHRVRREAVVSRSILDDLPGVGEKRKRAILQHFGSPEAFLAATGRNSRRYRGCLGKSRGRYMIVFIGPAEW